MASATVTETHYKLGSIRKLILDCTTDSFAGALSIALTERIEGKLLDLETIPGTPSPTANYDLFLYTTEVSYDHFQAVGLNRHTTNTEKVPIVYLNTDDHPIIGLSVPLKIQSANNIVGGAQFQIIIYYSPV